MAAAETAQTADETTRLESGNGETEARAIRSPRKIWVGNDIGRR
jgi:hypothetical protein